LQQKLVTGGGQTKKARQAVPQPRSRYFSLLHNDNGPHHIHLIITTTMAFPFSTLFRNRSLIGVAIPLVLTSVAVITLLQRKRRRQQQKQQQQGGTTSTAYEWLIANGTPMVKLERVSELLGRSIYVKMESLNPGGTGKDRAALSMIQHAEQQGLLPVLAPNNTHATTNSLTLQETQNNDKNKNNNKQSSDDLLEQMIEKAMANSRSGGLVVEGTSGSTGIALSTLCAARGHACLVVMPDDQAIEKQAILKSLGAIVYVVPNAAISNPNHYVNLAQRVTEFAQSLGHKAVFMNQFENKANYQIHYQQTGPEIWGQCAQVDAFAMSSGTGGTIAGVGKYLKERNPQCRIVLVDPPGSALYNKIQHGVAYASEQRERTLRRHRYDTLAEGIGLDRVTCNFALGVDFITHAIRVSDQEAVDMAHWLLKTEGLWVGSSSAMNVVGAIRTALELPPQSTVVTVICDFGQRHATRFWNPTFINEWGLEWPSNDTQRIPECLQSIL
jgi:cysteine synthase A